MIRAGLALGATLASGGCGESAPHPPPSPPANLVSATAPSDSPATPILAGTRLLIIEFPDGVRGGWGRIEGQGGRPSEYSNEAQIAQLRECGAVEPRFVEIRTHTSHVLSRSTPRDREVVACFRQMTVRHFNAGTAIYSADPREFPRLNTAAFHEFENRVGADR